MNNLLSINPKKEAQNIISFLKSTFEKQGISKAVIGLSGGVDSATSLYLLSRALPVKNITVMHLPYNKPDTQEIHRITNPIQIPKENIHISSIKPIVDSFAKTVKIQEDKIRLGNIAARTRMIMLFDCAKKQKALVIGTENRSEYLLSYFTRFGDEASDIEPIQHLYKTQIYALARFLNIPKEIIKKTPTAGLWKGQTDEKELGFTYREADMVLHLHFGEYKTLAEIKKQGFKNAEKILKRVKENEYKHKTPYTL